MLEDLSIPTRVHNFPPRVFDSKPHPENELTMDVSDPDVAPLQIWGGGEVTFDGLPITENPNTYYPQTFHLFGGSMVKGVPLLKLQQRDSRGKEFDSELYLLDVRMQPRTEEGTIALFNEDGSPGQPIPVFNTNAPDSPPDFIVLTVNRRKDGEEYPGFPTGISVQDGHEWPYGNRLHGDLHISPDKKVTYCKTENGATMTVSRMPLEKRPSEDYWRMSQPTLPDIDASDISF